MKNYVQPGENLDLTAPAGGVTSGVGVLIGRIFSIATATVSATFAFVGGVLGVASIAKTSAQAWVAGEPIYWDNANARADNVVTAGFRRIGVAVASAANPSATGKVRLDGAIGPIQGEQLPAPTSITTAGGVTYSAAQILGGIIVRDPNGAARSDTLPTAALLVAAIPGAKVGDIVRCLIVNGADGAEVLTILAGSGGTYDAAQIAASQVIGQNNSKTLTLRLTNVTASSEAYTIHL
jgi:predicted RecA/RadA family phage recombinase